MPAGEPSRSIGARLQQSRKAEGTTPAGSASAEAKSAPATAPNSASHSSAAVPDVLGDEEDEEDEDDENLEAEAAALAAKLKSELEGPSSIYNIVPLKLELGSFGAGVGLRSVHAEPESDHMTMVVATVTDKGPAAAAGLQVGDTIMSIGGEQTLATNQPHAMALLQQAAGSTVEVVVARPHSLPSPMNQGPAPNNATKNVTTAPAADTTKPTTAQRPPVSEKVVTDKVHMAATQEVRKELAEAQAEARAARSELADFKAQHARQQEVMRAEYEAKLQQAVANEATVRATLAQRESDVAQAQARASKAEAEADVLRTAVAALTHRLEQAESAKSQGSAEQASRTAELEKEVARLAAELAKEKAAMASAKQEAAKQVEQREREVVAGQASTISALQQRVAELESAAQEKASLVARLADAEKALSAATERAETAEKLLAQEQATSVASRTAAAEATGAKQAATTAPAGQHLGPPPSTAAPSIPVRKSSADASGSSNNEAPAASKRAQSPPKLTLAPPARSSQDLSQPPANEPPLPPGSDAQSKGGDAAPETSGAPTNGEARSVEQPVASPSGPPPVAAKTLKAAVPNKPLPPVVTETSAEVGPTTSSEQNASATASGDKGSAAAPGTTEATEPPKPKPKVLRPLERTATMATNAEGSAVVQRRPPVSSRTSARPASIALIPKAGADNESSTDTAGSTNRSHEAPEGLSSPPGASALSGVRPLKSPGPGKLGALSFDPAAILAAALRGDGPPRSPALDSTAASSGQTAAAGAEAPGADPFSQPAAAPVLDVKAGRDRAASVSKAVVKRRPPSRQHSSASRDGSSASREPRLERAASDATEAVAKPQPAKRTRAFTTAAGDTKSSLGVPGSGGGLGGLMRRLSKKTVSQDTTDSQSSGGGSLATSPPPSSSFSEESSSKNNELSESAPAVIAPAPDGSNKPPTGPPANWSVTDVCHWLAMQQDGEFVPYVEAFKSQVSCFEFR